MSTERGMRHPSGPWHNSSLLKVGDRVFAYVQDETTVVELRVAKRVTGVYSPDSPKWAPPSPSPLAETDPG
jgi:hypothetical protein